MRHGAVGSGAPITGRSRVERTGVEAELRLEITDAAATLADSEFERFLGRGRLGARLGEIVGKADNLAFNQTTIENAKQQ
jgi:hypothetical protein